MKEKLIPDVPAPISPDNPDALPSPAALASHPRLWKALPEANWPRWQALCRHLFTAYATASRSDNLRARIQALTRIMLAPQHALYRGRGGKNYSRTHRQLSNQIQRALDALQNNDANSQPALSSSDNKSDPALARALRASALVSSGHISRATRSLTQGGLLQINLESCQALAALHPPASGLVPPLPIDAPTIAVDRADLAKLVKDRLSNGAAPGYSGWTGELVLALIDDEECLDGLSVLIEDIINGNLSAAERDYIIPSSLLPARKGKDGVRPLAMREAFYKLAGHYCLSLVSDDLPPLFEPLQLAFSRGGTERAAHLLQARLELGGPDTVLIKTDVRNAFNEIHRSHFMSKLFTKPVLSPVWRLAYWAYSQPSSLFLIDQGKLVDTLLSRDGVQQGDVLSCMLYAVGAHDNYVKSLGSNSGVSGLAVVDDFYLLGPYGRIFQPFDRYGTESRTRRSHSPSRQVQSTLGSCCRSSSGSGGRY